MRLMLDSSLSRPWSRLWLILALALTACQALPVSPAAVPPSPTPTLPPDDYTLFLPGIGYGATPDAPLPPSPFPAPEQPTLLPPPVFKPGAGVQVHLLSGDHTARAFQMGLATPWVGPMILWNLNVAVIYGSDRPESAYSLLRPDGSYRPAYLAVRFTAPP